MFPFVIYGILWSLVWRYWLVYYDIKFARSTSHSKWKSMLNPKNDQEAWFIVNKKHLEINYGHLNVVSFYG